MTRASEQELIERCRGGDDEAFRELVEQHQSLVFGLLARSVADRARAEELAQEVFLKVHRGLPYFRGEARLSTWIFRIVANVLAEQSAGRQRDRRTSSLDERDADGNLRVEPASIERAYGTLELQDRLGKAIARLPAEYQIVVSGHYLNGMRYEDLAEALRLPLGTVKTHLHRAKRLLRQLLETELG